MQKLFEVTKVRDELTEWCEDVLSGLRTSVDSKSSSSYFSSTIP